MAHLHEKIDFTVAIFVIHDGRVLLVHHRKMGQWLPLAGHIELDEDPEQAALREAKEERGLEVEFLGDRAPTTAAATRALTTPSSLATTRISEPPVASAIRCRPTPPNVKLFRSPPQH